MGCDDLNFQMPGPTDLPDMGSKLQAVSTCIDSTCRISWKCTAKKMKQIQVDWQQYEDSFCERKEICRFPDSIEGLDGIVVATARSSVRCCHSQEHNKNLTCKRVLQLRRATRDEAFRRQLSKDI